MTDIITNKRVAITGGAGFIGANLIRKLLSLNHEINLLVRPSTDLWRLKDVLAQIKIHEIDIFDKQNLTKTFTKINPQAIIHLATYTQYRNQQDFEQMVETNIKGTLNILAASKDINYDVFINTGSSSEYGIKGKPMKEADILEPVSFYAATKSSATLLCQVFSREYKKPIVTLRPFSVYGPFEEKTRFIPTIIKSVIENKTIKLTPGNERRDFIYVDDVTEIYVKAIQKGKSLVGQILNMGTGIEYTNDEIVKTLFKVANKKVEIEKGAFPARLWDTPHWVADISKIKKLLNWEPKYKIDEGLRKTYQWYVQNE